MDIWDEIKQKISPLAAHAGLRMFGVVELGKEPSFQRFVSWVAEGRHADMAFLERNQHCREDPRELLAGSRSAVVFGLPYYQGDRHIPRPRPEMPPRIAQYARLADYHKVLWRKGEAILASILELLPEDERPLHAGRVIVDSAPVLERSLAVRSGGGFIGKNTCFIDPEQGSFFLLGEILLTLPLPANEATPLDATRRTKQGGCGSCRRCQVHCPTGALDVDYVLDANKCLSYWTIEHRGAIPESYWPWLRHYLYGCDICQLVCPYNRKSPLADVTGLKRSVDTLDLALVAMMSQREYEAWFGGTPMTRARREGLRRNALIALAVMGDKRLAEVMARMNAEELPPVLQETLVQIKASPYAPTTLQS